MINYSGLGPLTLARELYLHMMTKMAFGNVFPNATWLSSLLVPARSRITHYILYMEVMFLLLLYELAVEEWRGRLRGRFLFPCRLFPTAFRFLFFFRRRASSCCSTLHPYVVVQLYIGIKKKEIVTDATSKTDAIVASISFQFFAFCLEMMSLERKTNQ